MSQTEEQAAALQQERLAYWFNLRKRIEAEAAPLIEEERALRKELFAMFFPEPVEGSNEHVLPDGFRLKATYPIERKVDQDAFVALRDSKGEAHVEFLKKLNVDVAAVDLTKPVAEIMKISIDKLVRWEPKLETKEFKKLTAEQQKLFGVCLNTKPGSISMEVEQPKVTKAVGLQAP